VRHALEYAAARLALWTLKLNLKPELFALFYLRLLLFFVPRLRRTAVRNLQLAFPHLPAREHARIVNGSLRSLARILTSLARFPKLNKSNIHQYIRYEGFEHFLTAKARGSGILFATAHLGNWELSAFAHALMAEPMHIVVRPLDNPRLDALVASLRRASGNTVWGKRDFIRPILRALARNEAVGILIDQNVATADGIFVDFFGLKACVSTSFAKLANHSGAAIIPGFAIWSDQEQKFLLKFYPPLLPSGDIYEDTRRIHRHLESVIRQYPDQWLWFHRRWKTRPPGEPPLY
jgi:KDO2-lipid IV(A) lauroyltransferase